MCKHEGTFCGLCDTEHRQAVEALHRQLEYSASETVLARRQRDKARARVAELERDAEAQVESFRKADALTHRELTATRAVVEVARELCAYPCQCGEVWANHGRHRPQGCIWEDCEPLRAAVESYDAATKPAGSE